MVFRAETEVRKAQAARRARNASGDPIETGPSISSAGAQR
jgi:hypothetical protein